MKGLHDMCKAEEIFQQNNIREHIKKICRNKKHVKLTIGTLMQGEKTIKVWGETSEIPNADYVYEIASISKTFLCSILAKYVHERKVSLDDSISKYFDWLDKDTYYPTLKRLATHTAGYSELLPLGLFNSIRDGLATYAGIFQNGKILASMDFEKMKRLLLRNKLRDKDYPFAYSNFGMSVLGYTLGTVDGRGYWGMMDDFLGNDLGLKNTHTLTPDKIVHGYNRKNKDIGNHVWGYDYSAPDGCLSSTASDLLEYARLNIHNTLPYFDLTHQKHAETKEHDMGLAWYLSKENESIMYHTGCSNAFVSFLFIDKNTQSACVLLMNYIATDIAANLAMSILKQLSNGSV